MLSKHYDFFPNWIGKKQVRLVRTTWLCKILLAERNSINAVYEKMLNVSNALLQNYENLSILMQENQV